jgi:glutamate racemase
MGKAGDAMNRKEDYIAVFDSGVGGISVLRQLVKQMPGERFLYFGDSANAPYGTKSTAEVRALSLAVAEKLCSRGIKALVVACNTATSAAIDTLRARHPDLIVVGIEPAVKLAARQFPGGCIGVMATPVTLREAKFNHLVELCSADCTVVRLPAPGLPELVEQGKGDSPEADNLLNEVLGNWKGKVDALVLGCTHYPFAAGAIRRVLGENVALIDGGDGTARETKRRLAEAGLLEEGTGSILWENSANDDGMIELCKQLMEA